MKLRRKDDEGAVAEYTFSICDNESVKSNRQRKQRDYTHRHCIPRERYLHIEKDNADLRELARLRRTASLTCDGQQGIFETATVHEARNLSKEKHNSREVQRYNKEEVHRLNARITTLASQQASTRQRLQDVEFELKEARRKSREALADAESARLTLARTERQMESCRESAAVLEGKVRSLRDALKTKTSEHETVCSNLAATQTTVKKLENEVSVVLSLASELEARDEVDANLLSFEVSTLERVIHGGRGVGIGLAERVKRHHTMLDNLQLKRQKVPSCVLSSETAFYRNMNLVRSVVKDRDPCVVAVALKHAEMISSLVQTAEFQPYIKAAIAKALCVIQNHWSSRHSIVLQAEVHTSRSEYDSLRHLLSFTYDTQHDMYKKVRVWTNPFNEADQLLAPTIASRYSYIKEREAIYGECFAQASHDGLFCGLGNLEASIAKQVEHYWDALEHGVRSGEKELLLVLSGDATGGWRGSAVIRSHTWRDLHRLLGSRPGPIQACCATCMADGGR